MITVEESYDYLPVILEWSNTQCHPERNLQEYQKLATSVLNATNAHVFNFFIDGTLAAGLSLTVGLSPHYGEVMDTMVVVNPDFAGNRALARSINNQIKNGCKDIGVLIYIKSKHLTSTTDKVSIHFIKEV